MDLKEFWHAPIVSVGGKAIKSPLGLTRAMAFPSVCEDLGLFFWGRGGDCFASRFVEQSLEMIAGIAECHIHEVGAQDFLDCLACLGEEKVRNLIKGVEKKEMSL